MRVGEETGTLDSMLLRLAEYYELEVETAIAALGSVLEPVLIIGLGALVGFIVSSILIPLLNDRKHQTITFDTERERTIHQYRYLMCPWCQKVYA